MLSCPFLEGRKIKDVAAIMRGKDKISLRNLVGDESNVGLGNVYLRFLRIEHFGVFGLLLLDERPH